MPMPTFSRNMPNGAIQLSGNPIIVTAKTTTTGVTNHELLCKVTCLDNAIPNGPFIDHIAVDSKNEATFEISGVVDFKVDYRYSAPKSNLLKVHARALLGASIKVDIGESYEDANGDLQEVWDTNPGYEMTILKGEMPLHEYKLLSSARRSFYTYYVNGRRWFTRLTGGVADTPVLCVSSENDMVKASFAVEENKSINIACVTYYSDGTSNTYIDPTAYTCLVGNVYEVDLQKFVQNPDSKTVVKYEVQAAETEEVSFRFFTVYVDNRYYENHNVFYFANRYGVIETLHCFGKVKENFNVNGEVFSSNHLDINQSTHIYNIGNVSANSEIEINTGFKSLQERIWIKDLLRSEYVLLQLPDSPFAGDNTTYNLMPVYIVPGSYVIDETIDTPQDISFKIKVIE